MIWKQLRRGPSLEPAVVGPVDPPPPAVERTGLTPQEREAFAKALHHRWHGDHRIDADEARCAEISGVYDDVDAIEPLILNLLKGTA